LDQNRVGLSNDDNHSRGLHCNLLMVDHSGVVTRFDPYYSSTIAETIEMQKCLDSFLGEMFTEYQPVSVCKKVPFGPQLLDNSGGNRKAGEDFCVPWCIMVASEIALHGSKSLLAALSEGLQRMGLSIPMKINMNKANEPEATAGPYLRGIRSYTQQLLGSS
jgi:hypothetical protein